ncbi:MAG TPA: peptidase, partial [Armatimonadota bacterium]|nr:peptidase [Armatimonadota bacterium]
DTAFLEFTIDPDAEPGDREVRIGTPNGLTNAMLFQVGVSPEVYEVQPFGVIKRPTPVLEPPVVINGQCTPGDVDRFRIRARRGQRLVFQVFARHLNPYLADAVPGWFQALIALHDARGQQVAFADDDHFDPDPVLLYEVPEDGEYTLEIRDALYRGREDFVYRVQVSEQPFITRIFPLGGREGTDVNVLLGGWNLAAKAARLDTRPGHDEIRRLALPAGTGARHHLAYAVNTLPEVFEEEPNDTRKEARRVTPPVIINGTISRPGDVDCY